MFSVIKFFVVVGVLVGQALAASSVNNGSGLFLTELNPWYTGERPIKSCLVMSDKFIDKNKIFTSVLQRAIYDWQLTFRQLKPNAAGSLYRLPNNGELTKDFELEEICTPQTELKFIIGEINDAITADLKKVGGQLNGMSVRSHYESDVGRAKGYIWISPDVAKAVSASRLSQVTLFNTLLHELGHLFGLQHQKNGLMAPGAAAGFVDAQVNASFYGLELTSQVYAALNWHQTHVPLCAQLSTKDRQMLSRALMRTDTASITKFCMQRDANQKDLVFSLADEREVFQTFKARITTQHWSNFEALIKGYFPLRSSSEGEVNASFPHTFVRLEVPSLTGHIETEAGTKRFVALLNPESQELFFDLENEKNNFYTTKMSVLMGTMIH